MTTTTAQTTQVYQVFIKATPEAIWDAITKPEFTERYFYKARIENSSDGHRSKGPDGSVWADEPTYEFEPPRRLVHTHWSDVSGKPDDPEHYQVVVWELAEKDGGTDLTIRERNLPSDDAAKTSEDAWKAALGSLKTMLER